MTDSEPRTALSGAVSSNRPHAVLSAYYESDTQRRGFVRKLFDATASDYERIERMLSFGTGAWYRRQALLRAGLAPGMRALDVAVGTGLVARAALTLVGEAGEVIGLDPSAGMLREARAAVPIALVQGLGEQLPFADAQFDFISMGYALRHVADLGVLFREFRRVLRPEGVVLALEIARPESAVSRAVLKLYLRGVAPLVSRVVGRTPEAPTLYHCFWDTIEACVPPPRIIEALQDAGVAGVRRHIEGRVFSGYTARC
jgi:demethylmenaquinone methyltransferase/2-methoxy-6-polyprenyl-1,4-benzoquinol methylase